MRIAMIGQKGLEIGESGGGIEQHVAHLANQLATHGHTVFVYARKRYASSHMPEANICVRFVPTVYRKNWEAIVHSFFATLDALFRRYDIIHYHGVGPATLAWVPRLLKRHTKVIVTFHSQDRFHRKWNWLARQYLHFGEWAACYFPHATIAVSQGIQVYARDHYHKEIYYIPNGVEVQKVKDSHLLRQFHLTPKRYLLNVGRLVPHKGQHYLVEAYKRLQEMDPQGMEQMDLVCVGGPSYTIDYERELQNMVLRDPHIHFVGFRAGEELRQLYANAYLYVHPSESEGLSVVVLEAMSYGLPVLVSDIPANLEAIDHHGFTFRNKDVADLTRQLFELLHRPETVANAGARAKEMVRETFNWDRITMQTLYVYTHTQERLIQTSL